MRISGYMKAIGRITTVMVLALSSFRMEIYTRGFIQMENLREKAFTNGLMVSFMMVSGSKDANTDRVSGRAPEETLILENGRMAKLMDTVFMSGLMGTVMKVNF